MEILVRKPFCLGNCTSFGLAFPADIGREGLGMLFVDDLDKSHFEPASASTVRRRCDDYTATMRRRYGDGTVKIRAAHGGGCLFPSEGTKEQPIKPKCVFKNFSACRRLISSGVFHRITNTPDRMNDFWTKFGPRKKSQKKSMYRLKDTAVHKSTLGFALQEKL